MYLSAETKSLWSHDSIQLHTFREQCLIKDKDTTTSNMREEFVIEKQKNSQQPKTIWCPTKGQVTLTMMWNEVVVT
jgi:hypothetical protein